ncbi:PilZ domain-containing protein [uncultured Sphingomonas sp.]|uniref:PilZ domain-containing protein n=1 Tax=uncultured Sphingomonas sp. TaxID=158754 RepID=UPI0025D1C099|nr:PilZ domain-containing protein [uncultured Sphingomonas sp.]
MGKTRERRPAPTSTWEPVRWPVEIAAELHEAGSCWLPVKVLDLSADGCRMHTGFHVRPGRTARLRIPGFAAFAATIEWDEDWHAGLRFDQPIHPSVIYHLAARYRATRGEAA